MNGQYAIEFYIFVQSIWQQEANIGMLVYVKYFRSPVYCIDKINALIAI